MDLVFHFRYGETGLTCESEIGILTAETFDGFSVEGYDTVRMVGDQISKIETVPGPVDSERDYILYGNFPNPFNPETEIRFQIPEAQYVVIRVFNSIGKEVRNLAADYFQSGTHHVKWDGKDINGNVVTSGVYFCYLQAGKFTQMKKMILIK